MDDRDPSYQQGFRDACDKLYSALMLLPYYRSYGDGEEAETVAKVVCFDATSLTRQLRDGTPLHECIVMRDVPRSVLERERD